MGLSRGPARAGPPGALPRVLFLFARARRIRIRIVRGIMCSPLCFARTREEFRKNWPPASENVARATAIRHGDMAYAPDAFSLEHGARVGGGQKHPLEKCGGHWTATPCALAHKERACMHSRRPLPFPENMISYLGRVFTYYVCPVEPPVPMASSRGRPSQSPRNRQAGAHLRLPAQRCRIRGSPSSSSARRAGRREPAPFRVGEHEKLSLVLR